jgi:hypothetical protein
VGSDLASASGKLPRKSLFELSHGFKAPDGSVRKMAPRNAFLAIPSFVFAIRFGSRKAGVDGWIELLVVSNVDLFGERCANALERAHGATMHHRVLLCHCRTISRLTHTIHRKWQYRECTCELPRSHWTTLCVSNELIPCLDSIDATGVRANNRTGAFDARPASSARC